MWGGSCKINGLKEDEGYLGGEHRIAVLSPGLAKH